MTVTLTRPNLMISAYPCVKTHTGVDASDPGLHVENMSVTNNIELTDYANGAKLGRSVDVNLESVLKYQVGNVAVLMLGDIQNAEELQAYTLRSMGGLANHAELIARLYLQRKFHFLPTLQGKYTFILVDSTNEMVLAARDASGFYELYQASEMRTGWLVVTNVKSRNLKKLSMIPAGTFIFGKAPGRLPHKIGSQPVGPVKDISATQDAVSRALSGVAKASKSLAQSATKSEIIPHMKTSKTTTQSNTRATSSPRLRTSKFGSPSAVGTADRANSWRKTEDQIVEKPRISKEFLVASMPTKKNYKESSLFKSSFEPSQITV
mmetsp:Transcript_16121/g.22263  ORF Transcript_16121/g.22263 Transcript_16121/m.22263 type:complete len:322 (-) Transcript_16121:159-1124(-)|eukprot:CAMPEP_0196579372 /NCGR_PEP_ID=MMETSP1081-20130531/21030_1 /TAXON_ID=36882 /ORGANISM="Pyramimonas amylifera, Strain CCMP720" /LENGTH=321 /DNA_ID=CAMNT_0041898931 /DNA_START=73 /DNA_END=1038 /DNA_ORIENTATION=+